MSGKHYSQYLLRALDGEDLRLDEELSVLVELGNRLRRAVPPVPYLEEDVRHRILSNVARGESREPAKPGARLRRMPWLAWAGVAVTALAMMAAILVVFLLSTGGPPVREYGEIAMLRMNRGEAAVRDAQGNERAAGAGELVVEGETIIAGSGARGIVEFPSGSILRMLGEAEIGLSTGEDGVVVDVYRGKSYHRVADGTPYTARSGNVVVTAKGTAFSFDVEGKSGKVITVHSSVGVAVESGGPGDWTSVLAQGSVFVFGEEEPRVLAVTPDELRGEWLKWNSYLDKALGLPAGAFTLLEESVLAGEETTATPEQPPAEESMPPQPSPQPVPQPAPPPAEKSISLSASARQGAVDFSWTVSGYSGFQGFKLCRSETNSAPVYPGDWWMYIDGAATRSATDTSVQAGRTYYYRLAAYNAGSVLGYSNAVKVTVPGTPQELSISLAAVVEGGKVKLSWNVGGEGDYSGFKVCRSETNPNPGYPGEALTLVDAAARSYVDASVISGYTYYYRLGIYKDGGIIKYSNAVKVVVP